MLIDFSGTAGQVRTAFRTEIPKMFAALVLVALTGVAIYMATAALSRALLGRWHESEMTAPGQRAR